MLCVINQISGLFILFFYYYFSEITSYLTFFLDHNGNWENVEELCQEVLKIDL